MPRPSKIDRLPGEIRELIGKLRSDGRTIDEILAKLGELNVDVSRSGLGRHVQELDAVAEQIRRGRAITEGLVERFGEGKESAAARINVELMHGIVSRLLVNPESSVELTPKEAQLLGDTIDRLSRAAKNNADLQIRAEKRAREKMAEQLKELEAKETKAGRALDPDTIRRVREIYGIA